VTQAGSKQGLDTLLKVYGPRLSDGSYPKTLDDAGFGKLSKIKGLAISIPGFYLVEVTNGPSAAPAVSAKARLKLSCTGTCDSELPIAPLGLDLRYFQRAAERKAASLQTYATATQKLEAKVAAGVPSSWGVVLDIDETTLDNSAYQKRRADLGLGFSPATWNRLCLRQHPVPHRGVREEHAVRLDRRRHRTEPAVVMFVGDNIQDFPLLTQEVRREPDAAFAKFGDSFFVLPNPMYGSWEKNLD